MGFLKEKQPSQLILGDCLDWMRKQPDKSIDLIITDPPYGLNYAHSGRRAGSSFNRKQWDQLPDRKYFDEMRRISHNQIIWGGNYFTNYLPSSRCWIAWWKNEGLPRLNFADAELAWTSFDRNTYVFNCRWRSAARDSPEPRYRHPTQKPEALMRWCIETFSEPGQLILDPFLGSGTTALAAKQLERRCIGIEKDPEYMEIAKARLFRR
jgi:site-specific DNA-methyltransferase (adenine-specific)